MFWVAVITLSFFSKGCKLICIITFDYDCGTRFPYWEFQFVFIQCDNGFGKYWQTRKIIVLSHVPVRNLIYVIIIYINPLCMIGMCIVKCIYYSKLHVNIVLVIPIHVNMASEMVNQRYYWGITVDRYLCSCSNLHCIDIRACCVLVSFILLHSFMLNSTESCAVASQCLKSAPLSKPDFITIVRPLYIQVFLAPNKQN